VAHALTDGPKRQQLQPTQQAQIRNKVAEMVQLLLLLLLLLCAWVLLVWQELKFNWRAVAVAGIHVKPCEIPFKHVLVDCQVGRWVPLTMLCAKMATGKIRGGLYIVKRVQTWTMPIYTKAKMNRKISPQLALDSVPQGVWHCIAQHFENAVPCSAKLSVVPIGCVTTPQGLLNLRPHLLSALQE
jgi:hypothetical protein